MNFPPPLHNQWEGSEWAELVAKRLLIVSANFARWIAPLRKVWMPRFLRRFAFSLNAGAFLLAGCSENRPPVSEKPLPANVTPHAVAEETSLAREASPPETPTAPPNVVETAPVPDPPVDPNSIERRFLAAQNDPAARIAAIRDLANATPAAALTTLNRLFLIERREDVKGEMFTILTDLDHAKDRDNQLALCTKGLAPGQPTRIRYLAIHTMAELHDPRARGFLLPLLSDPDGEIRAAARQALSDLAQ